MSTNAVSPHLDPANWHPGDAHAHSKYSKIDLDILFVCFLLWNPLKKLIYLILGKPGNKDLWQIEGCGELAEVATSAGENGLCWVCMTEHGPNLGMPPLIEETGQNLFGFNLNTVKNNWGRAGRELCHAEETPGACHCMIQSEELSSCWRFGHLLVYDTQAYLMNDPRIGMLWSFIGRFIGLGKRFKKRAAKEQRYYIEEVVGKTNGDDFCFIAHPVRGHCYSWEGFEESLKGVKRDTPLRGFELLNDTVAGDKQGLLALLDTWDRFLGDGYRVRVVGGSDGHLPKRVGAQSRTFIYSTSGLFKGDAEVSRQTCDERHGIVLASLHAGNAVVTNGPLAIFTVTSGKEKGSSGDKLAIKPGGHLEVEMACGTGELSCREYRIICSITTKKLEGETPKQTKAFVAQDRPGRGTGEIILQIDTRTEATSYSIPIPDDPGLVSGYVRVEGYGESGTCYTNPVFLVTEGPAISSQDS